MNQSQTPSIVVGGQWLEAGRLPKPGDRAEAASRILLRLLYAIRPDDPECAARGAAARKRCHAARTRLRYAFTAVRRRGPAVKVESGITQERRSPRLIRASAAAALVCVGAIGIGTTSDRAGGIYRSGSVIGAVPSGDRATPPGPIGRDAAWIVVEGETGRPISVFAGGGDGRSTAARLAGSGEVARTGNPEWAGITGDDVVPAWTARRPLATALSQSVPGNRRRQCTTAAGLHLAEDWAIGMGGAQRERPGHVEQLAGAPGNAVFAGRPATLLVVGQQYL